MTGILDESHTDELDGYEIKQVITPAYPMVAVMYSSAPTVTVWAETIHLFGIIKMSEDGVAMTTVEPLFKHDHGSGMTSFEPYPSGFNLGIVERSEWTGHEDEWLVKAQDVVAETLAQSHERDSSDKLN